MFYTLPIWGFLYHFIRKKSCRWLDCEKNWISLQGKFSCFIYIGISLELIGLYWSYKLAANFHVFIMVLWKKFNALNKQYMYVFVKHCQFAWVKVVNTLPIWGFLYHFIRKKSCCWLDCKKNWIKMQGKFSCFIWLSFCTLFSKLFPNSKNMRRNDIIPTKLRNLYMDWLSEWKHILQNLSNLCLCSRPILYFMYNS